MEPYEAQRRSIISKSWHPDWNRTPAPIEFVKNKLGIAEEWPLLLCPHCGITSEWECPFLNDVHDERWHLHITFGDRRRYARGDEESQ